VIWGWHIRLTFRRIKSS